MWIGKSPGNQAWSFLVQVPWLLHKGWLKFQFSHSMRMDGDCAGYRAVQNTHLDPRPPPAARRQSRSRRRLLQLPRLDQLQLGGCCCCTSRIWAAGCWCCRWRRAAAAWAACAPRGPAAPPPAAASPGWWRPAPPAAACPRGAPAIIMIIH